jgi:hypothetical protein
MFGTKFNVSETFFGFFFVEVHIFSMEPWNFDYYLTVINFCQTN